MAPADLDTVQLAPDKYVKDPALKERLVLAAYKGTNPFLGRVPGAKRPAEAAAKAGTSPSKPVGQTGTATQTVKKATAQPVEEPNTRASNSASLATTSGVSVGHSVLRLAFAGAAAVIVFVLWRARGASGGPN